MVNGEVFLPYYLTWLAGLQKLDLRYNEELATSCSNPNSSSSNISSSSGGARLATQPGVARGRRLVLESY